MADVTVKVLDKGPLLITGAVDVVDAEDQKFSTGEPIALCRCGLSKNKPFCDGLHKDSFDDCARAAKVL